ncbi:MAG: site-specific integrase [Patescibacteria group bacterium]|nr:site-specific integrase [Patescibacteria group bacterium]MDD4303930.1 site-specific integrase [Patescibacteria group bacterium]MDD4695082.1 site-specific integrase [Patescibacteria group bacterium]
MSIFKRGKKYWIGFRFNRIRYRMPSPENSFAGAKVYESLIRQKLARGEEIVEKVKEIKIPLFEEFSYKWHKTYVMNNNKPSEQVGKKYILDKHLIPFFGKLPLNKISVLKIEEFKAKKLEEGLSPKTINNILTILSKCLKTAQEWECVNQVPKMRLLNVPPQKFDFLSNEELSSLLIGANEIIGEMILMVYMTGLRFGELAVLDWSDVDLKNKKIIIRRSITRGLIGSTKSNKIRYIPLAPQLLDMLEARSIKTGLVFPNVNGKSYTSNLALNKLHSACQLSGLRKIGWHNLRHTFASHLVQRGISILVVKELLGHSDVKTTMRYSHLGPLATVDAIRSLSEQKYNIGHNMATICLP